MQHPVHRTFWRYHRVVASFSCPLGLVSIRASEARYNGVRDVAVELARGILHTVEQPTRLEAPMRSPTQSEQVVIETSWRIVTFMKMSHGDERFTAKQTPCTMRLVRRAWKKYFATSTVNDAKRSGRPTLISRVGAKLALEKLLHSGNSGSANVAQQLAAAGTTNRVVHKTTVIRAAKKAAHN